MRFLLFVAAVLCLSTGNSFAQSQQEIELLKAPMRQLSAAVYSVVAFTPNADQMSSQEILEKVYSKNPHMRAWFKNYSLSVKASGHGSTVLLCDKDGTRGLIEDTGCNAILDRSMENSMEACMFTIKFEQFCKAP